MRLKRFLFWSGIGFAALAALLLVALAGVLYRPDLLAPLLLQTLRPSGGTATAERFSITLKPLALTLEGLSTAGPRADDDRVRIARLSAVIAPAELLRGGQWLSRLEASGVRFERKRPKKAEGPLDLTPLTRIFRIRELSASDVGVLYAVTGGHVRVEGLRMSIRPLGADRRRFETQASVVFSREGAPVVSGSVLGEGVVVPGPVLEANLSVGRGSLDLSPLSGELTARGALRLTRRSLEARGWRIALVDTSLSAKGGPRDLGTLRVDASGSAALTGRDLSLQIGLAEVPGMLRARGRLSGRSAEELGGIFEGEVPDTARLWSFVDAAIEKSLPALTIAGPLPFRCRLEPEGGARKIGLELFPDAVTLDLPARGVNLRPRGWLRAEGTLDEWSKREVLVDGRLDASGRWRGRTLAADSFRAVSSVSGPLKELRFPDLTASAPAGGLTYGGRVLPLGRLEGRAKGAMQPGGFRLEGLELSSESAGRVAGDLSFGREGGAGTLAGRGLKVPALVALASAATRTDWGRWNPVGTAELGLRLGTAGGRTSVAASADVRQVAFSSPDGKIMAQNLGGRFLLKTLPGEAVRFDGEVSLSEGEALWDTAYVDLGKGPLEARFGAARTGPDRYRDVTLEGGLGGFGRVSLRGEAARGRREWRHSGRLMVKGADLERLFATLVRDPRAASNPALARLNAGGSGEADLWFRGEGKRAEVEGRLNLHAGSLRRERALPLLSGLELELPFAYEFGGRAREPVYPPPSGRWGRLRVAQAQLSGERVGPLDLRAALVPNRLFLEGAIAVPLFGGSLSLTRVRIGEPLSSKFRVEAAATLKGIDLARLPTKSPLLQGQLEGALDPVRFTREELTTVGALNGTLLGGRVEIRDPIVTSPLGRGREMGADVLFTLLDLERVSAALDVGRITGRISGAATGLRVAYGEPVAFHLRMESVPVKGVKQRVSLKAVNSISLLGTGAGLGGMGLSVLKRFFREFPYERIGFDCTLRNDVFTVRGLIREGGVEYLVKRPLFTGINVVNGNPDNRISFSDMVDRLHRVTDKSGSATIQTE